MENIKSYLKNNIFLLIVIGILILTNVSSTCYFLYNEQDEECFCEECVQEVKEEQVVVEEKIKVDIKGYVNAPGVYELTSGSIINDLIKLAGGLKTNGTTDNINLSKELKNEDMIVVLSKSELKKLNIQTTNTSSNITNTSSNNSTSSSNQTENKKVSLNTATKEELMTLSGIGEAKALSIIEYRKSTPFKDISEIKNISGIGESVYENIKNYITI